MTDQAYRRIRDDILEGRCPPGAPLSRRSLSERMAISSAPVAAALARLEHEGFVETRPRAGARVKIPSPDEIRGQYVVREALETHSARLFAETAGAAERRKLAASGDRVDRAYRALTENSGAAARARVERAHFRFHLLIAEATRCRELVEAIERSRVLFSNWIYSLALTSSRLPDDWHSRLAAALIAGTPDEAAAAMRLHVRHRREEVIEAFREINEDPAVNGARLLRGPQRRTLDGRKQSRKQL